jgi:lipopolysaccharide export LptBFGC system permease protein LptF
MTLLDRYIARQFLLNILVLLLIVASLIVTVDVVINLDRFADRARQLDADASTPRHASLVVRLVADLWGPRLLQLFVFLNGVVLAAAMGFTCTHLVRHREFVAMLAGGISLHRAARPFLAVAAAMLLAQVVVQELALPRVAHLLPRDAGDAGKERAAGLSLRLSPDDQGRLWYARAFDDHARSLEDLAVWERDDTGALTRTIVAARAAWDGRGWTLEEGFSNEPLPPGGAAPRPPRRETRIDTTLDPDRIKVRAVQGFVGTLSWRQITRLLDTAAEPHTTEQLDRARWSRLSGLAASFLALWGSLAIFLVRSPRPMVVPALKSAPIALGGFAAAAVASSASIPGLPVWFGAFVPTIVLLSVTIALVTGVDT